VLPAYEVVAVNLVQEGEEVLSTFTKAESAEFLFANVQEGQYSIEFVPGEESGLLGDKIDNINVILGEVTDVGETVLVE
jgi:hypothetical protein